MVKVKRNFVLPTILEQLDQSEISLGNIDDLRDYLYVDDLISAFWACIKAEINLNNMIL